MLGPKSVDISNNSWISQVKKSIVNGEVAGGRRVEDCKFCVFYSSSEEVGNGVSMGMERHCIKGGVLRSSSLKVYSIFYAVITDVLGDFLFISFIDKDKGVMFWICHVVLNPIPTRVICIFLLAIGD